MNREEIYVIIRVHPLPIYLPPFGGRQEAFLCIVIENGFYLCVGSSELVLAEFDELLGLF